MGELLGVMEIFHVLMAVMTYMTVYVCQNSSNHKLKKRVHYTVQSSGSINVTFKANKPKLPPLDIKQAVRQPVVVAGPKDFTNQELRT